MVAARGQAKISDFGLAKLKAALDSRESTLEMGDSLTA